MTDRIWKFGSGFTWGAAHSSSKGCVPTYILSNITYAVLLVVLAMEVEKKSSGNLGLGHLQEGMVLGIHLLAQGILDFFGESLFNGNIYCCYLPLCFGELFVMVSIHWIQHPPLLQ